MANLMVRHFDSKHIKTSSLSTPVIIGVVFSMLVAAVLSLPVAGLQAQETIMTIEEDARQISLDPFSNLYLLTGNKELRKYDRSGKLEATYSDLELSDLSLISSDHPFKSLIYYPEYDLIRVFGNKLQVLAELNLTLFGIGEITCVAPSTGYQSFWIFDATGQKLMRINQQYDIVDQGSDLIPIIGETIFPTIIKEREGWVYVYDPDKGIFIFDNFGAFSKKLPIVGAESFSVFKDRLFFISKGRLFEVDTFSGNQKATEFSVDGKILGMTFRQIVVKTESAIEVKRF